MSSTWESKKLKGNDEFKKKNYSAAAGLYTEGIFIDPSQDVLYSNRGLCYMNLHESEKAKMDFSKAIELNPKNVKALKRISYMHIQEGKLLEALVYLNKIQKLGNDEPSIASDIKQCEILIEYKKKLDDNQIIKDWKKCYDLCKKLIEKCNRCFEIKIIYFESMINLYKTQKALSFYKTELSNEEKNHEKIKFLVIQAYFNDGKYDKSKQLLLNLQNNTNDILLIEKTKNLSEKLEQIQNLKEKASIYYKNNDFNNAITIYSKLLSLDNNNTFFNALILSNRSLCYYKLKDMFKALHDINNSIKLNNNYWKSYQRRANINIKLKCLEEAKEDLNKVLELDPTNIEARNLLNEIFKEEKKNNKKDLYKILEVNKNSNAEEIRKSFKKLVLKWHPDKNGESEEKRMYAEIKFKEINSAYNILSDPYKRDIYDQTGKDDLEVKYDEKDRRKKERERSRDDKEYMKEGFHY